MFCGKCGHSLYGIESTVQYSESRDSQKIQTAWKDLKLILVFYILTLAVSLIYGLISYVITSPKLEFVYWSAYIIIVLVFLKLTWSETKPVFKFYKSEMKVVFELIGITICAYGFLKGYFYLFEYFQWPTLNTVDGYLTVNWPIWSFFVLSAALPAIFEEIAFRGIIQTNLAKVLTNSEALIIQAALFSVIHISPIIFISHFVMGLLVGWIRFRVGHIYYGIILHFLWNSAVIFSELEIL
ncbi:MAG: membrane protease YdiL (CAAX protease family) [Oleiphilaceae bacterium]|jgi:membrane protease YdiL (CAAX protease family)